MTIIIGHDLGNTKEGSSKEPPVCAKTMHRPKRLDGDDDNDIHCQQAYTFYLVEREMFVIKDIQIECDTKR